MQCLALDLGQHPFGLLSVLGANAQSLFTAAVDRVAKDRMTSMRHMHADLVCPPRFQPTFEQTGERVALEDGEIRRRRPTALDHRHLLAVLRVAVDRRLNPARFLSTHPPDQGHITAFDLVRLQALGQRPMRDIVLGYYQQAAGFFVESVHNART